MGKKLKGIIILQGILCNKSPFIIGKGKGDIRDIEILKDEQGKPFIPATSFLGALKNYIFEKYPADIRDNYFWGDQDMQSHFIVSDLKSIYGGNITGVFSVRDGIAIENTKGVTKEKAKYDYEIVEKEIKFKLNSSIKLMEGCDFNLIFRILKTCIEELKNGRIFIGAMTAKGFGRFKLEETKVYFFEFPKDGEKYLLGIKNDFKDCCTYDINNILAFTPLPNKDFIIEADFSIKSALIVSSHSTDPDEPDSIHIKSDGKSIIPGTSLKGSIRARAEKIINTFNNNGVELIKNTFGWVDTESKDKRKFKSRVIVEESVVENDYSAKQTRVKIDRFTGGAMYGALVETKPLWHKNENIRLKITIKDFEPWEAGLLILILKDLWTSDLPIGGEKAIGRGLLKGKNATIKFENNIIKITENNGKLEFVGDKEKLTEFVNKFTAKMGG